MRTYKGTTLEGVPREYLDVYQSAIAMAEGAGFVVDLDCHSYLAGVAVEGPDAMMYLWDPGAVERETEGNPAGWNVTVIAEDGQASHGFDIRREDYGLTAQQALEIWETELLP